MLRLAYFSDIHGNDLALKAVLRDIDAADTDLAVCGEDLWSVTAPTPTK